MDNAFQFMSGVRDKIDENEEKNKQLKLIQIEQQQLLKSMELKMDDSSYNDYQSYNNNLKKFVKVRTKSDKKKEFTSTPRRTIRKNKCRRLKSQLISVSNKELKKKLTQMTKKEIKKHNMLTI